MAATAESAWATACTAPAVVDPPLRPSPLPLDVRLRALAGGQRGGEHRLEVRSVFPEVVQEARELRLRPSPEWIREAHRKFAHSEQVLGQAVFGPVGPYMR